MRSGWRMILGMVLMAAGFCRAEETNHLMARLDPVPPFSSVSAAALTCGIPLSGMDPVNNGDRLFPGDALTALITLHAKGGQRTQWLLDFQVTTNRPLVPGAKTPGSMVMHTSSGNRFEFARSPARMIVRSLGPFQEPNPRRRNSGYNDKSAPISVNQGFLGIGLDRGAVATIRWNQAAHDHGGTNYQDLLKFSHKSFDSAKTNLGRLLASQWQVTPEEERGIIGWVPALNSYFETVQETPSLQDIMLKVADPPSLWSILRNRGVNVGLWLNHKAVAKVSLADWGLPAGTPIYSLPMDLFVNNHKTLRLTMIAAAPHPPLLTCGGIIGFLAENPAEPDNYLTLRVISAHCRVGLAAKF